MSYKKAKQDLEGFLIKQSFMGTNEQEVRKQIEAVKNAPQDEVDEDMYGESGRQELIEYAEDVLNRVLRGE